MEIQVTYLFGAGASVGALPLVKDIPNCLDKFLNSIKESDYKPQKEEKFIGSNYEKVHYLEKFYSTIELIKNGAETHSSIDTFAKKLFDTEKKRELHLLKSILSLCFIYEQFKNKINPRYDTFFASIINYKDQKISLPNNLKILSWNYDFQFEKAFGEYSGNYNLSDNQRKLNVCPANLKGVIDPANFAIFKLNGTTSINVVNQKDVTNIFNDLSRKMDYSFLDTLLHNYLFLLDFANSNQPMLNFAWEFSDISQNTINQAILCTKNTNVLVVIGYSFPYFNRTIDRKIIREMQSLQKIYFQAPGNEAKKYIDRFRSIIPDVERLKPEPIEDVEQFFLPHEL